MSLIVVVSLITVILVAAQSASLSALFEWQRHAIEQHEWWRILTGNLTHTNTTHLIMNVAALWLITWIFRPTARSLMSDTLILALAVGIGLLFTPINGYVGLSGVLHALFACFALREVLMGKKQSLILIGAMTAKVLWEQTMGAANETEALIGAPVAIDAHLIGAIAGLAWAVVTCSFKRLGVDRDSQA